MRPSSKRRKLVPLIIAGFSAGLLAAAGVLFLGNRTPDPKSDGPRAPSASAPAPSASVKTAAPATTAPAPKSTAAEETPPTGFGFLTVEFPSPGNVYMSGKKYGPTNERLQVPCGRWFIRVSSASEGPYPEWLSPGDTVAIACQASTRITLAPGSPRSVPTTTKKKTRRF
jgi:eukaryotic-like serine/threonine-protein kinase